MWWWVRCPWLQRKTLAEEGNGTTSGIPGKSQDLLSSVLFHPSFPLTDSKIHMCWCKPASTLGRTAPVSQASRKISTLSTAEMYQYRELKPRSIMAFWWKSDMTLVLLSRSWAGGCTRDLRKSLSTCIFPYISDPLFDLVPDCPVSEVQLLHRSGAVAVSHQPHGSSTKYHYGLYQVVAKPWSQLCRSWLITPNAPIWRHTGNIPEHQRERLGNSWTLGTRGSLQLGASSLQSWSCW